MSSPSNQAAWLNAKGDQLQIGKAPMTKPESGELLIKNHAVAMNPVDWKMQESGYFIKKYPTILGCDLAGEVIAVGEGVSNFKTGDRVLAHPLSLVNGKLSEAAFQKYTVVLAAVSSKIPDDMSFANASVLPLSLSTASAGLFDPDFLGLPHPTSSPKKTGKTLLVWGGSSSVGSSAIQLAVAAGVEVVTTASKKNFNYCKKLGARAVFDHSSLSVVGDLTEELQKGEVAGAFDAIGSIDALMNIGTILAQLGGGTLATVLEPPEDLPATVKTARVFAPIVAVTKPEIGKAVYGDFLPDALASGQFVPSPEATISGEGLESIQGALDKLKAGVSATKLVVVIS